MKKTFIPADVAATHQPTFAENYNALTKNTNRLFLFAADQKIEHLNQDFYGPDIAPEANDPHHIFRIATHNHIGGLATQLGLINRYGAQYPTINYIAKLNSKTNMLGTQQAEPFSSQLWSVEDVVEAKNNSGLPIRGIGYTLYIGSEYESAMLEQAAQVIYQAHQQGLVAILWVYPRGKSIQSDDPNLFIGASGLANALGADFVKLHLPRHTNYNTIDIAAQAAGNTGIICAGGQKVGTQDLIKDITEQLKHGTVGAAVGRNIFQRTMHEATALTQQLAKIIYEPCSD